MVSAIVQIDIDGNLRPSGTGYDVGVYEQPGCIQDLSITMNYSSGMPVETAANTITATNTISGTAAVTYIAGNSISLLPGFEVQTVGGATFHAFIQSCVPANFQTPVQSIGRQLMQTNKDVSINTSLTEEAIQLKIQPNLVNNHAQLQFYLPSSNPITLTLFDLHGRLVKVLCNGVFLKGWHQLDFQKGPLSSGIYYVTLQNKSDLQSQKIYILNAQ